MKALFYYFERDLVKWLRGRVTVVSSLVMPATWLVFVGLALPTKFTDNYLEDYKKKAEHFIKTNQKSNIVIAKIKNNKK